MRWREKLLLAHRCINTRVSFRPFHTGDKIDVHSHHIPPPYLSAISKLKPSHIDGIPISLCSDALAWNPRKQIAHQDTLGISKAYLSISSPGTHLTPGDDQAARDLTKACNDWTFFELCSKPEFRNRIGMLASLPLPDRVGSVSEIARVQKKFSLNSFVVMTNSHGIYVGDEILDQVWKELDRIKALVCIHPTAPCIRLQPSSLEKAQVSSFWDSSSILKGSQILDLEDSSIQSSPLMIHGNPKLSTWFDPLVEFQFETARALTSLLLSDSFVKFPNIHYIVPHAGGALSSVLDRVFNMAPFFRRNKKEASSPQEMRKLLNDKCHFDLAGSPFPYQIQGLFPHLSNSPSRQLLYGSDFPWTTTLSASERLKELEEGIKGWDSLSQERVWRANASELMKG